MKSIAICSTVVLVLSATGLAWAGTLLFVSDTTTDLDIGTVLVGDGHTVVAVTDDYSTGNATLKGDLSPYDAVYWSTSQVLHNDPDLLATLTAWVEAGGRLFVTGADGPNPSYNPTPAYLEFLGATGGEDGGFTLSPIADRENAVTMGVVDVRGETPLTPGDSDAVCGQLAAGTVGLSEPTFGTGPCPGNESYGSTARRLGLGEIAWVESGNFTSTVPHNEPLWSDSDPAEWGAYNAAVRDFALALSFDDGFESGDLSAWTSASP